MDNNLKLSEAVGLTRPAPTTTLERPGALAGGFVRDLLETVLPALLIAIFMVVFVIQPTRVDGSSMAPTLTTDQRLVIEKVSYHFTAPALGDIVVLKLPGREATPLIKRVIGVGGDQVAIRNGRVYLNGAPLDEPYLSQITPGDLPSMVVPDGYLFVLGDNRGASNDSRNFGMVPEENLVGRAAFSYWPLDHLGLLK